MKKTLLTIAALASTVAVSAQCNELFFSEYAEGSSQNKALEVYNPTQGDIDLSDYVIKRYANGATTAEYALILSGMLASGDVVVVTNGQTDSTNQFGFVNPDLLALADIVGTGDHADSPMFFNGDDALTLEKTDGTILDIFGKVGEDPGSAWTDDASANYTDANGGTWWTRNKTLIRKPTIETGVTTNPGLFNATLEWDSLPSNTWSELGQHTCNCIQVGISENDNNETVLFFPNPSTGSNFMVKASATIESLEIYNVLGELVYTYSPTNRSGEILVNGTSFSPGMYLVRTDFHNKRSMTSRITIK